MARVEHHVEMRMYGRACVIENVCFVGSDKPVDIAVGNGRIASVRPSERPTDAASKIWVIPGLWDCHTHFTQWSYTLGRLDLIDARSAGEALDMLRRHLEERRESGALDPNQYVVGMRFRHSLWSDDAQPTLAAIDAVAGDQPVALSSADMHCGWVNSAAARKLGVDVDESGLVGELEWFDAYCKLDKGPGAANELMHLLRNAEHDAASKGVVACATMRWRRTSTRGLADSRKGLMVCVSKLAYIPRDSGKPSTTAGTPETNCPEVMVWVTSAR